jgi:uncharacterized protein
MPSRFELSRVDSLKSQSGSYRFVLKAANNEPILTSESYTSKAAASTGIESVKKNAASDERYQRKTSQANQPYFVLTAANGEPIGTSEMYANASARDNGIDAVKAAAAAALLDDKT